MSQSLLLEFSEHNSEKVSGTKAYAIVFDPLTGKALDPNALPHSLANFTGVNNLFAFPLTNDRLYHWQTIIQNSDLSLPDSAPGRYYIVEYWVQLASGSIDRTKDYLIKAEELEWMNNPLSFTDQLNSAWISSVSATFGDAIKLIKKRTDLIPDEPASARYECFCSVSFDSTVNRLGFCAWLEKDGQMQTGVKSIVVTITDSSNNLFLNLTLTVSGSDGQKYGQSLTITPAPDETYFMKVVITDANNVVHTSGASPVTWD